MGDNATLIENATSILGLMDGETKKYDGVTPTTANAALALLRPLSAALAASDAEVKRLLGENAKMREALESIAGRDYTGIPSFMPVEVASAALAPEAK